jgi:glycosyltransferase involved in cell wall biosynthesis
MNNTRKLRVLIVLYYWPPAGGPGVQRWLKFVKYLKDFNIIPTVFVPENPHYPLKDKSLELEVTPDIEVIKSPIKEPYKIASAFSEKETNTLSKGIIKENQNQSLLQKAMLFARGNLFIPDARALWIKPSVKRISKLFEGRNFDALITTGPPHSLHRIGFQLKEKFPDLPWIADFRDPWTNIGYHDQLKLSESSQKKHLDMEKEVLTTADAIIVTSPTTKKEFKGKTSKPVHLITNGYDDAEVNFEPDEHFSLAHIGTLLNERNPEILWEAISELVEEDKVFESHLELRFVGQVSENIQNSIRKYNLQDHARFLSYLPHKQAQQEMFNAQVLLLIEKNKSETQGIIPGKLFEYFQAQRPILGIGPKDWDVSDLIKTHHCGFTFEYNDKKEIKYSIKAYYEAYMKGKLFIKPEGIQVYHRKQLTERLSDVIRGVVN